MATGRLITPVVCFKSDGLKKYQAAKFQMVLKNYVIGISLQVKLRKGKTLTGQRELYAEYQEAISTFSTLLVLEKHLERLKRNLLKQQRETGKTLASDGKKKKAALENSTVTI